MGRAAGKTRKRLESEDDYYYLATLPDGGASALADIGSGGVTDSPAPRVFAATEGAVRQLSRRWSRRTTTSTSSNAVTVPSPRPSVPSAKLDEAVAMMHALRRASTLTTAAPLSREADQGDAVADNATPSQAGSASLLPSLSSVTAKSPSAVTPVSAQARDGARRMSLRTAGGSARPSPRAESGSGNHGPESSPPSTAVFPQASRRRLSSGRSSSDDSSIAEPVAGQRRVRASVASVMLSPGLVGLGAVVASPTDSDLDAVQSKDEPHAVTAAAATPPAPTPRSDRVALLAAARRLSQRLLHRAPSGLRDGAK